MSIPLIVSVKKYFNSENFVSNEYKPEKPITKVLTNISSITKSRKPRKVYHSHSTKSTRFRRAQLMVLKTGSSFHIVVEHDGIVLLTKRPIIKFRSKQPDFIGKITFTFNLSFLKITENEERY